MATHSSNGEAYYDIDFDADAIAASIAKTYNILPSEQENLSISDFVILLQGLDAETPLATLIKIRSEKNPERIRNMSAWEKSERQKWFEYQHSNKVEVQITEEEKQEIIKANEEMIKASLMSFAIVKHKK